MFLYNCHSSFIYMLRKMAGQNPPCRCGEASNESLRPCGSTQDPERGRAESSCISLVALLMKHYEPRNEVAGRVE